VQAKRWTTSGTKEAEAAKKGHRLPKGTPADLRDLHQGTGEIVPALALLFGERIWPGGLSLDGIESRTLMDGRPTFIRQILAKARQTAQVAPASVMHRFEVERADLMQAHFGQDGILAWPMRAS